MEYILIKIQKFLHKRFFYFKHAYVLGKKIKLGEFETFFTTYKEIFIDEVYKFDSKPDHILDCGANIGLSILWFQHKYPGVEITAFEPHPELAEICRQNTGIDVIEYALYNNVKECTFYTNRKLSGGASLIKNKGEQISVRTDILSKDINNPVHIKMDVEGVEVEILEELDISRKIKYVKEIICEYHHRGKLAKFISILEKNELIPFFYDVGIKRKNWHCMVSTIK